MPITTRSSARNEQTDMYKMLLSSLQSTINEGVVLADDAAMDSDSGSDDDEQDPNVTPASRAAASDAQASLATPAGAGSSLGPSQSPVTTANETEDNQQLSSWPLSGWEHQLSMPQPAAASSKTVVAAWAKQKAQPATTAHAPIQDAKKAAKASAQVKEDTAGPGWFDMKAQDVTDEVKRDWRLLRLRAAFDPKKFYKFIYGLTPIRNLSGGVWRIKMTFDSTKIPKYFQRGTIIEGTGEFYSARLTRRERKQTFAEEIAADIKLRQDRKRRFTRLQEERQELARKRKKARALHKRSKHRPKH